MNTITIETTVQKPIGRVWEYWNTPDHITHWAFASDTWECPHAENDLRVGGRFLTNMAAKDGSTSFDFTGIYTDVQNHEKIAYTMDDGRTVTILFESIDEHTTKVIETFEMEHTNSEALQRDGWQAILDSFKNYTERT